MAVDQRTDPNELLAELVDALLARGCVSAECVGAVLDQRLSWSAQRRLFIQLLLDGVEGIKGPTE